MIRPINRDTEILSRRSQPAGKEDLTVARDLLDTLKAQMNEIAKAEGVTEKTALEMAIANERMNRGVAELVNNWEDWKKILKAAWHFMPFVVPCCWLFPLWGMAIIQVPPTHTRSWMSRLSDILQPSSWPLASGIPITRKSWMPLIIVGYPIIV